MCSISKFYGFSLALLLAFEGQAGVFSVNLENDMRGLGGRGGDKSYTNGLRFSYLLPEQNRALWFGPFDQWFSQARINTVLAIGQHIYTPTDIQATSVIADDRPYSGWLYGSYLLHVKRPGELQTFEVSAGWVGKGCLAATTQDNWHALIGRPRPKGWANELSGEPGLLLGYQFNKKLFEKYVGSGENQSRIFEAVPGFGGVWGNVLTGAYAHLQMRLGYNLSDDFLPIQIFPVGVDGPVLQNEEIPNKSWEFYGFLLGQERFFLRNIFIDGNSFQPSHHVDKEPFVPRYHIGAVLRFHKWMLIGQQAVSGPELRTRSEQHVYGSITFVHSSNF